MGCGCGGTDGDRGAAGNRFTGLELVSEFAIGVALALPVRVGIGVTLRARYSRSESGEAGDVGGGRAYSDQVVAREEVL